MNHVARNGEYLFINSFGKKIRITGIFTDIPAANAHMETSNDAVIAVFGPFIFLADKDDQ